MSAPVLETLQTLARAAGEILRDSFPLRPGMESQLQVERKGVINLVTDIDHRSEALLVAGIRRDFPFHTIVTEESGTHPGDLVHAWYVDPLDGTVNYAHGVPLCCVSLGYAQHGEVLLGVVYDPLRDELFSAERGGGAHLNNMPLRVSAARSLDDALLVTGFPYDIRTNPQNNLEQYARFALRSQGVRRLGSAALDLCYVAAGRFDGYWEYHLNTWDFAAGMLIAAEAGAVVTTAAGGEAVFSPPYSILAANPFLHPQMLAILNGDG